MPASSSTLPIANKPAILTLPAQLYISQLLEHKTAKEKSDAKRDCCEVFVVGSEFVMPPPEKQIHVSLTSICIG